MFKINVPKFTELNPQCEYTKMDHKSQVNSRNFSARKLGYVLNGANGKMQSYDLHWASLFGGVRFSCGEKNCKAMKRNCEILTLSGG